MMPALVLRAVFPQAPTLQTVAAGPIILVRTAPLHEGGAVSLMHAMDKKFVSIQLRFSRIHVERGM